MPDFIIKLVSRALATAEIPSGTSSVLAFCPSPLAYWPNEA